jgi:hypothetical protein
MGLLQKNTFALYVRKVCHFSALGNTLFANGKTKGHLKLINGGITDADVKSEKLDPDCF